jgi:glycine dehydrogenase subunit 2
VVEGGPRHLITVLAQISDEAYANPELVKTPHNQAIHRVDTAPLEDPAKWAMTWRAYKRKQRTGCSTESPP